MKKIIADFLGWGFLLWLIGYMLGFVFFMLLSHALIGWVILPIGIVLTLFVLFKKITSKKFNYYLYIAFLWTLIAVTLDYLFIVKMLKPADGYYKMDVYIYYLLTFALPISVGWFKQKNTTQ